MKNIILNLTLAVAVVALGPLSATADDLGSLAGKWVATRNDTQGRAVKQTLDINKNKFTFTVVRDGETVLYAKGEVKTEQLGPFKSAKFYNIQGGSSPSDLQPVDDDRTVIYTLGYNELTVAVNFDRERDEPAMATRYTKTAATPAAKTLVIDKIVMHKSPQTAEYYLCFDATVGLTTKRFNIPNKAYENDGLTITTDLAIPSVNSGETCKFVMKLDDVPGDECTDEMDNRSAGSFTVTDSGSQDFKPEDDWNYTIYWHLK